MKEVVRVADVTLGDRLARHQRHRRRPARPYRARTTRGSCSTTGTTGPPRPAVRWSLPRATGRPDAFTVWNEPKVLPIDETV